MKLSDLSKPVNIEDIDFRVQSINGGGYATILAYKDARYDMKMLDSIVGPDKWQKDYKIIDGNLYCGVAIRFDDEHGKGEWVWKWDVGIESNADKEKGHASDAFKRACFNWGIGRELYDFPLIQVKLLDNEWEKGTGAKPVNRQTYNLKLKEWRWELDRKEDGSILSLRAYDQNGTLRFNSNQQKKAPQKQQQAAPTESKNATPDYNAKLLEMSECTTKDAIGKVWATCKELHSVKDFTDSVKALTHLVTASDMTILQRVWEENATYHTTVWFKKAAIRKKTELKNNGTSQD